jgi:TonB family protein
MRIAIIISLVLHLVVGFVGLRLVRISQVRFVPREVYAVRLVSLQESGGAPQREEMKAPPKETPKELPPQVEEKKPEEMVAPAAKQRKAKQKEPTPKTVPSTRIEKSTASPEEEGGEGSGTGPVTTGDLALDVMDFPFAYYLATIKRKIALNWQVPATAGTSISCRVYFRITRSGAIDSPAVEASSGSFMFDQAALRAVVEADPLPPLPGGFADNYLGVHFSFAYEEE